MKTVINTLLFSFLFAIALGNNAHQKKAGSKIDLLAKVSTDSICPKQAKDSTGIGGKPKAKAKTSKTAVEKLNKWAM